MPSGTWKVYIKDDIRWETYNINNFNTQVITTTGGLYKPLSYTPSSLEITTALGYSPYNSTNPNGYISSYTETDPIWTAISGSYRTKTQNDLLYEPIFSKNSAFNKNFGTSSGTVAEGNDSRILNGQTAFNSLSNYLLTSVAASTYQPIGSYLTIEVDPTVPTYSKSLTAFSVIKTDTDLLYPSLTGSYVNPSWITSIPYTKITGAPTIPNLTSQLTNDSGFITASSASTLTNKSGNISQWTNDSAYLTSVSFASLIGKPTTLSGYGITDAYPLTGNPSGFLTGITSGQVTGALGFTPLSTTGNGSGLTGITNTQISGLGTAATTNSTAYATAAQGIKADTALQVEIDGSITNEIQTLSISGSNLSLSSGGGTVSLPIPVDYTNTVSVAGGAGNAIFYLTSDKTSTGTALYTNVNYVNPIVNDSTVNYTYGWSYNAGTKALTVNVKQAVGINVALVGLTLLGIPSNAPNGTSVQILVKGN